MELAARPRRNATFRRTGAHDSRFPFRRLDLLGNGNGNGYQASRLVPAPERHRSSRATRDRNARSTCAQLGDGRSTPRDRDWPRVSQSGNGDGLVEARRPSWSAPRRPILEGSCVLTDTAIGRGLERNARARREIVVHMERFASHEDHCEGREDHCVSHEDRCLGNEEPAVCPLDARGGAPRYGRRPLGRRGSAPGAEGPSDRAPLCSWSPDRRHDSTSHRPSRSSRITLDSRSFPS